MAIACPSCSLVAKASAPISLRSAPAMNWPGLPLRKSRPFRSERSLSLATRPPSSIRTACPRVLTFFSGRSSVSRPMPSPRSSKWNALDMGAAPWDECSAGDSRWEDSDLRVRVAGATPRRSETRDLPSSGRIGHQDLVGLDARDGFEPALGHGLAQPGDRAEVGVG